MAWFNVMILSLALALFQISDFGFARPQTPELTIPDIVHGEQPAGSANPGRTNEEDRQFAIITAIKVPARPIITDIPVPELESSLAQAESANPFRTEISTTAVISPTETSRNLNSAPASVNNTLDIAPAAPAATGEHKNFTLGYTFRLGGRARPVTEAEKEAVEISAFAMNQLEDLVRGGCQGFYYSDFKQAQLPGTDYRRDIVCNFARQLAEQKEEVQEALVAAGIEPLPPCEVYDFPYRDVDDFLREVYWYASVGRGLYLGALQVISNNAPLTALISSLLTQMTRIQLLLLLDVGDRENINPIPSPFDVAIPSVLAYQLLVPHTDGCQYLDLPAFSPLTTQIGLQYPLPHFPSKNEPPTVVYQFNYPPKTLRGDPDSKLMYYIAWMGGVNNVTLTEARNCGVDPITELGCVRANLPRHIRGTISALLLDSNATDEWRDVNDLLRHTVAGPAHLVLT